MGMNVGGGGDGEGSEVLSAINTTPLVDVMLVLLIIFLITIPVITKTVPLALPKEASNPTKTKPENITIAVDGSGNIYWNDGLVPNNEVLISNIRSVAVMNPQPEVHIRGDKNVRYEYVGRVVMLVQRGGVGKVGFISEPPARGGG
jgi:biopolymer transport protein ExbD